MNRPCGAQLPKALLGLLMATTLSAGNAAATVIDMEGIAPAGSALAVHNRTTDGFYLNFGPSNWGVFWSRSHPYVGASFPDGGSDYVSADNYWSLFEVNPRPFSIQNFRAAAIGWGFGSIEAYGMDATTRQWTHLTRFSIGSTSGFQTFSFDPTWTNLWTVAFRPIQSTVGFDDFLVNQPVPEPSSLVFLVGGLAALALRRRRS